MSVKRGLTTKRVRELPDYSSMVRRVIRAHGRRVGDADPEDMPELLGLKQELDEAIAVAVMGQRRNGFSWAAIGRGLGVTRQAAQMTWGGRVDQLELVETRRMLAGHYDRLRRESA